MAIKDPMGDRMKEYEIVSRNILPRRIPKILRLDGKSFHTLLAGAQKPYDSYIRDCMIEGIKAVMTEIGGTCVFCYSQSDEASFVLNDNLDVNTSPWFNNNIQKIVSVSASIMSVAFTKHYNLLHNTNKSAVFDARVFVVPEHELNNAILWRQFDATKNSVQCYARSYFSHKSLIGLKASEMQDKMMLEKQFNWNDAPTWTKRGFLVERRDKLVVNLEIPQFNVDKPYLWGIYNYTLSKETLSENQSN